jgi:hypothetical protein
VTEVTSHQGTHTYRLSKLLKSISRCAKPLSPSAAQKRDYEPLPYFRQALQKIFFPEKPDFSLPLPLLLQPPLSLAAAGEGRILRISQLPSSAFLKIVELAIQHRDYCQLTKP